MKVNDILNVLQEDIKTAVVASIDSSGQVHARHINIGLANEKGIFFMTSSQTNFYHQIIQNPNIALTAMKEEDYLIQVIRIEGQVRELGKDKLAQVLEGNPYFKYIYPDGADQAGVQVFQLYQGQGFYHSLTQGHKYIFEIKAD